jgi:hypothetical protein
MKFERISGRLLVTSGTAKKAEQIMSKRRKIESYPLKISFPVQQVRRNSFHDEGYITM